MNQIKLALYIPKISTYQIFYPEEYILEDEDESGILTITNPDGISNFTLSSYSVNSLVSEEVLLKFYSDIVKGYEKDSDLKLKTVPNYLSCEQEFVKDGIYWIWWAVANNKRIIVASCNSDEKLRGEEYHLFKYMLNEMEIFDDE